MKIAQLAPLAEAVPPKLYGGTERVVSYLTEELVALGQDVTLFASGDSQTSARLVPIGTRSIRLDPTIRDVTAPLIMMLHEVARRAAEFDVIHAHIDFLHLPLFHHLRIPHLSTLHGRLDWPEYLALLRAFADEPFVSISDAQRQPLPSINWLGTVHHGLPQDLLPFTAAPQGYLAFIGRIAPDKGPERAIRIARSAGLPLKIAAKICKDDGPYFEGVVKPMLDSPNVEFVGEISESEKGEFLGNAAALLFPIVWPEPFGLAMIEAMACGTPVIAFNRGSVPEVLENGATGFIVEDESGAAAAVQRLGELDRSQVRAVFDQRFTSLRMAEKYMTLYRKIAPMQSATRRLAAAD